MKNPYGFSTFTETGQKRISENRENHAVTICCLGNPWVFRYFDVDLPGVFVNETWQLHKAASDHPCHEDSSPRACSPSSFFVKSCRASVSLPKAAAYWGGSLWKFFWGLL